jgi:hypothetical protein
MSFEENKSFESEDEIILTAQDIILVPFNPDRVDLSGKIPSNEQNASLDEQQFKRKLGNFITLT